MVALNLCGDDTQGSVMMAVCRYISRSDGGEILGLDITCIITWLPLAPGDHLTADWTVIRTPGPLIRLQSGWHHIAAGS